MSYMRGLKGKGSDSSGDRAWKEQQQVQVIKDRDVLVQRGEEMEGVV